MMAWYVFALVDRPLAARPVRGLAGALTERRVPGGFAIVERRADVPPVELGALKKHDAVVTRLAEAVPAILPVRYGTLLEAEEIDEALAEREEELAEAFERVRGRVQFTWRRGARGARGAKGVEARSAKAAAPSGAEYLREAARAKTMPAEFRALREKLGPLVAVERYQPATASLPDSLYHLVDRGSAGRYRLLAEKLASATPVLRVTGPFPPFAFASEWL